MPRRNERLFQQPSIPTYDEAKLRAPRQTVYVDKKGREWLCEYLVLGDGVFGKTDKSSDATHRGFTWSARGEIHQRVSLPAGRRPQHRPRDGPSAARLEQESAERCRALGEETIR